MEKVREETEEHYKTADNASPKYKQQMIHRIKRTFKNTNKDQYKNQKIKSNVTIKCNEGIMVLKKFQKNVQNKQQPVGLLII